MTPESGEETYDAVLLVAFGGPEGPDDVIPFLRNVTRGRDVPIARLEQVASNYRHFGGVSPLNSQCRRIRDELSDELTRRGSGLRVFWGNRNWHPFLADAVAEMAEAGVQRALAVVMSAYSSYSACRQYLEDISAARATVGPGAPRIDKVRAFHDHPGFVQPFVDAVRAARERLPSESRDDARLLCTAHSIPMSMARGCDYEGQLSETARLVAAGSGFDDWTMVWQSRSGPPAVPWLEPDINDHLRRSKPAAAVVAPIGFVSDHMEVVWDLDVEARVTADEAGIRFERAETPGTTPDPRFVAMLADLVEERLRPGGARLALALDPRPDTCPAECCPAVTELDCSTDSVHHPPRADS